MSKDAEKASAGIGIGWVLFIVFLILKLTGTITWSWWWVTAPLWAPLALVAMFGAIASIILVIGKAVSK